MFALDVMQSLIHLGLNQTYRIADHSLLNETEGSAELNKQT